MKVRASQGAVCLWSAVWDGTGVMVCLGRMVSVSEGKESP